MLKGEGAGSKGWISAFQHFSFSAFVFKAVWHINHMAGYRRPLSRNELQQIRRQKMRVIFFCALGTLLASGAVSGAIYLLYTTTPR